MSEFQGNLESLVSHDLPDASLAWWVNIRVGWTLHGAV